MNKRKENPNYVHGVYYIPRKGEKERKNGNVHMQKRKEKKKKHMVIIYPNTSFPTTDERIICSSTKRKLWER